MDDLEKQPLTEYAETMRRIAGESFDQIHGDVDCITLTDFPDYSNIGDSAIAVGQFAYWRARGIVVDKVFTGPNLTESVYSSTTPIAIQGGGNLGGLYPPMDAHRIALAAALPPDTLLIQLPQSVVFCAPTDRDDYEKHLGRRPNTRVAARDRTSLDLLAPLTDNCILAPDGIHHLGSIDAKPATEDILVLARTDKESALGESDQKLIIGLQKDWPRGRFGERASRWVKYNKTLPQVIRRGIQKPPPVWQSIAQRRLDVGVSMLSSAEIIVTDRLHAMLIALQMGRRVIAIDNSNNKLTNYAETWFPGLQTELDFTDSMSAALTTATTTRF